MKKQELEDFEQRVRALQKEFEPVRKKLMNLYKDIPKHKESIERNITLIENNSRILANRLSKLLAALTMDKEIRVGEPAISEVSMPYQSLLVNWCSHEEEVKK